MATRAPRKHPYLPLYQFSLTLDIASCRVHTTPMPTKPVPTTKPTLNRELHRIEHALQALRDESTKLLTDAPVTDEFTPFVGGNERYVLARPDGYRYWNVPGQANLVSGFQQRPAALRVAQYLPGCRVYDSRTHTYITAAPTPTSRRT